MKKNLLLLVTLFVFPFLMQLNAQVIVTHPSTAGQSVCVSGTTTALTVAATGTSLSYLWFKNTTNSNAGGTSISGATAASYTPPTTTAGTTYYYVRVTSGANSVFSNASGAIVVITKVIPAISIAANTTSVCTGTNVNFTATPTNGGGAPTYQWRKGGVAINGATGSTYSYAPANGDAITCILTPNNACQTTNSVTSSGINLTANAYPTVANITGTSVVCTGNTTTLANATTGGVWSSYSPSNATVASGVVSGVAVGSTTISYTVTSAAGCATTKTAPITVNSSPSAISVQQSGALTSCTSGSVTFTATGGDSILWSTGAKATSITVGTAGTYTATSLGANGCNVSASGIASFTGTVTTVALGLTSFCSDTPSARLQWRITNSNTIDVPYTWYVQGNLQSGSGTIAAGATLFFFSNRSAGTTLTASTYSKTCALLSTTKASGTAACSPNISDAASSIITNTTCNEANGSVAVNISGGAKPYSYLWTKGGTTVATTPNLTGVTAGTYSLKVTSTLTGANSTVSYVVPNIGIPSTSTTNASICQGSSYDFNGVTYTNSGVYVAHLTNAAGCDSAATLNLTVNPMITPAISVSTPTTSLCRSSTAVFTAIPLGADVAATYQWYKNGDKVGTSLPIYTDNALVKNDLVFCVLNTNNTCQTASAAVSNVITMTATYGLWIGGTNTSWGTAQNWCASVLPTNDMDVIIPASATFHPAISGCFPGKNITIESGATLTVTGTLQIKGSVTNGGTINATTGTIEMNGTTAQTIAANTFTNNTIQNFKINNPAGVTLADTLKITGTLYPTNGVLNTGGNLVLKSTATGTARIAEGSGNYINDAVTVERYISPKGGRKYSFVTATATQTIRESWQQQIYITGSGNGGTPCGAGTGNGGAIDRYNSNGFDKTVTNMPTVYTYNATQGSNNSRWTAIPNTATNLVIGKGYRVNVRGDRNSSTADCNDQLNSNTPTSPQGVALSVKGTIATGTVNVTLNNPTTHAYTLLGNPYPSQISFSAFYAANSTNINNKVWSFSPFGNGNYTTYSNGLMVNAANGYDNNSGDIIASGQAFFVEAKTTGSGIVTFQESHKAAGLIPNNQYFGTANQQLIRIALKSANDSSLDEAVIRFNTAGDKNYLADWDASSLGGGAQSLAIQKNASRLAIATFPVNTTTDSVLLTVKSSTTGSFKLNFSDLDGLDSTKSYVLRDAYLNKSQNIRSNSVYAFNVTADSLSKGDKRFFLLTKQGGTTLPVRFVQVVAKANDKREVAVQWTVADAKNVTGYALERSIDGESFTQIATSKASNATQYSITDVQLSENIAVVYYRIRSIELNGQSEYSNIVKLTTNNFPLTAISIYPNPAKGAFSVQLPTIANHHHYSVSIYALDGKEIRTEQNLMPNANNNLRLTTNGLKSGMYQLKVQATNGASWTTRLQVVD